MREEDTVRFERCATPDLDESTLIEGFPGHGLVAGIVVERVREQLGLDPYGRFDGDALPTVAAFRDGCLRPTFRADAGTDPDVIALLSEMPVSHDAIRPLARCVRAELAPDIDRAIFLGGIPTDSPGTIGTVVGVGTDPDSVRQLTDADITLTEGHGTIGGITGALLHECFRAGIPAVGLFVRTTPFLPDPAAAKALIENGLAPLVAFDIDTEPLDDQAADIHERLAAVADQYRRHADSSLPLSDTGDDRSESGMFQ